MKINGKNAVIATMAIAMAAGIAGSISGTVAWFQYNTRVTSEFTGTTAKCTEFLQVRTVKNTISIQGFGDTLPTTATSGWAKGNKFVNSTDSKIYTCTSVNASGNPAFDSGVATVAGAIYQDSTPAKHIYKDSAWGTPADADLYGTWKTGVTNADIVEATGGASSDGLKPVTAPYTTETAAADAALGALYGQPVCGYEQYAAETYKWQEAETSDYYGFGLQFRVLDIDGTETGAKPKLYAQDLYLMDITVGQPTADASAHGNISSALRVYVDGGTGKKALLAPGDASAATVTTTTHGNLDLGGATGDDTVQDVPNNYSWTTGASTKLDYGKDKPTQVAYNMNKKMGAAASNGLYPVNDGYGHLSGGKALGTTTASDGSSAVTDGAHLTINFKIFLEGWQSLGETPSTLWSSTSYIGAQFNIGMSFGVTTLD